MNQTGSRKLNEVSIHYLGIDFKLQRWETTAMQLYKQREKEIMENFDKTEKQKQIKEVQFIFEKRIDKMKFENLKQLKESLKKKIPQITIEDEIILADKRAKELAIIHRDAKEKLKKEYESYVEDIKNSMTQTENMFTIGEIIVNQ